MGTLRHGEHLIQVTRFGIVNCYLVREEDGFTLVDTGLPRSAKALLGAAHEAGGEIVRIVLTHAHGDHAGSVDAVREELPGVELSISERESRLLAGDMSLEAAEAQAKLRGSFPKVAAKPDRLLNPGDRVGALEVVAAPGHTPGQIALLDIRDRALIAGDAFQTLGGVAVCGRAATCLPAARNGHVAPAHGAGERPRAARAGPEPPGRGPRPRARAPRARDGRGHRHRGAEGRLASSGTLEGRMAADPLASFTQQVREWFGRAFAEPTEAQRQAWPAIAGGEHVIVSAPTGSGKTLAAFLWGLDRLVAEPASERRTRLVYVSPLKALSYDVEKNLRAPLKGIGGDITVGIRTGDTPQKERQAMLRNPPDVLITTPESLYLMLTSRARETLAGVEWCIVDEIHAVARTKRGSHLALSLERLEHASEHTVQRIGLSATQRPLEEVGRFLVGAGRDCRVVDTGVRKPLDLEIRVPVDDMREPAAPDAEDPAAGGTGTSAGGGDLVGIGRGEPEETGATRRSIWPAIYPELLELVQSHRSTIVFVNNRRGAERLAVRLNELAGEEGKPAEIARAHHGSLAREERLVVEDLLKSGELPCLVATSSLELGIDMGAVDLVLQVESPKSVTAGLQRIGRAGHNVGDVSKGRIFPKFRADLLECAVVARRMRDGEIETTVVPRNALDVLAQQIVAMTATGDEWRVPELHDLVRRAYPYADLSRELLDSVLDMLDGRYPSEEFAELRPRIVWDRVEDTVRARKGALQLAVTNAGTIPDRGLYGVHLPDGRRVGELDEEMVYEARPGQTFMLGASTWRIEEITRDRVIVSPAPGAPGALPFWRGDGVGRPVELGRAIGEFSRTAVDREPAELAEEYDLDERAARNLVTYLREQREATRVVPSDRTIVIERFRDEIGDWRLCVLSPFGGRVHAAWGLALSARIRDRFGLESDAIWSDDGIVVHLPDADEPPGAELVLVEPDELEELVVRELSSSALYGARFRENAARALLLPRAYPGKRTPLWQQRLKAQSLLEVAKGYGQFPIVLETYRECLRDVLDLPGARGAAARPAPRASSPWSRPRPSARRHSPRRCCSTTWPPTCTRATRPTPSGAPQRCRWTATCFASCSARRSCAT